jgi:hypothetical protein
MRNGTTLWIRRLIVFGAGVCALLLAAYLQQRLAPVGTLAVAREPQWSLRFACWAGPPVWYGLALCVAGNVAPDRTFREAVGVWLALLGHLSAVRVCVLLPATWLLESSWAVLPQLGAVHVGQQAGLSRPLLWIGMTPGITMTAVVLGTGLGLLSVALSFAACWAVTRARLVTLVLVAIWCTAVIQVSMASHLDSLFGGRAVLIVLPSWAIAWVVDHVGSRAAARRRV